MFCTSAVTTAIGAESFYNNANNATRLEDPKGARELDLKILRYTEYVRCTLPSDMFHFFWFFFLARFFLNLILLFSAWVGHPKVFIIDNSTDFDGKMNRVVTTICRLLGVPRCVFSVAALCFTLQIVWVVVVYDEKQIWLYSQSRFIFSPQTKTD